MCHNDYLNKLVHFTEVDFNGCLAIYFEESLISSALHDQTCQVNKFLLKSEFLAINMEYIVRYSYSINCIFSPGCPICLNTAY